MVTPQDILQAATRLPDSERVELIEALLASFDPSSDNPAEAASAWHDVATRRAAELDCGAARTYSWEEVRQEGERRIDGRTSS